MTKEQIESLLERFADWPPEAQGELLQSADEIGAKYGLVYRLDGEERAALERSAEDIRLGRLAPDAKVRAVFDRYRRG